MINEDDIKKSIDKANEAYQNNTVVMYKTTRSINTKYYTTWTWWGKWLE
jgi:hypothetical protein